MGKNPYLINIFELINNISEKRISHILKAEAGLSVEMACVPEGSDISLDLKLANAKDGILANFSLEYKIQAISCRTLKPYSYNITSQETRLYMFTPQSKDEDAVSNFHINIAPAIRDIIVLSLPLYGHAEGEEEINMSFESKAPEQNPLGAAAENGLQNEIDPRWNALKDFYKKL